MHRRPVNIGACRPFGLFPSTRMYVIGYRCCDITVQSRKSDRNAWELTMNCLRFSLESASSQGENGPRGRRSCEDAAGLSRATSTRPSRSATTPADGAKCAVLSTIKLHGRRLGELPGCSPRGIRWRPPCPVGRRQAIDPAPARKLAVETLAIQAGETCRAARAALGTGSRPPP